MGCIGDERHHADTGKRQRNQHRPSRVTLNQQCEREREQRSRDQHRDTRLEESSAHGLAIFIE
jgi:hypothetical protein